MPNSEAEERVAAALATAREQERRQFDERARLDAIEREKTSQERTQLVQQAQMRAQQAEQQAAEAQAALTRERQARAELAQQLEKVCIASWLGCSSLTRFNKLTRSVLMLKPSRPSLRHRRELKLRNFNV